MAAPPREFTPVAQLAERYDLIILDHPFAGDIAASRCLLPLDELVDEAADRAFVEPSLASIAMPVMSGLLL